MRRKRRRHHKSGDSGPSFRYLKLIVCLGALIVLVVLYLYLLYRLTGSPTGLASVFLNIIERLLEKVFVALGNQRPGVPNELRRLLKQRVIEAIQHHPDRQSPEQRGLY